MPWALVDNCNQIFQHHNKKYSLLKGIKTKEPISKRTIGRYRNGDKITVIFSKRYLKWFRINGKSHQEEVNEGNKKIYTLREVDIPFK